MNGVTAQDVANAYHEPWAVQLRTRTRLPPEVYDTYTVQIIRGDDAHDADERVRVALAEAEENITDLLPAGWRARVAHWTEAP
jgi:hypothetical protein